MLPRLVERGLLVEHTLHRPHHGLEAVQAEGEGPVGLAVPVALLPREGPKRSLQPPQAVRGQPGETGARRNQAIPLGPPSRPEWGKDDPQRPVASKVIKKSMCFVISKKKPLKGFPFPSSHHLCSGKAIPKNSEVKSVTCFQEFWAQSISPSGLADTRDLHWVPVFSHLLLKNSLLLPRAWPHHVVSPSGTQRPMGPLPSTSAQNHQAHHPFSRPTSIPQLPGIGTG